MEVARAGPGDLRPLVSMLACRARGAQVAKGVCPLGPKGLEVELLIALLA